MKFIIRADSSTLIGSGHVMRCLALAQTLKENQHQVSFICRNYPGNLIGLIEAEGFQVHVLGFQDALAYQKQKEADDYDKWLWVDKNEDAMQVHQILGSENADWLIVDHYALDQNWQQKLRAGVNKIMVIDDLANRRHDCDLLLDTNYYDELACRYDALVSTACTKLLGTQYALIRPEFRRVRARREAAGKFEQHVFKNILIYLGAADRHNFTTQIMTELLLLPQIENYQINILVGTINPHKKKIAEICMQHDCFEYHEQPSHYHDLLVQADVAISAGGSSTYERCFLGIPSLVFVVARNQAHLVAATHQLGAIYHINELTTQAFADGLADLNRRFSSYVRNMAALVDGFGLKRVYQAIEKASGS